MNKGVGIGIATGIIIVAIAIVMVFSSNEDIVISEENDQSQEVSEQTPVESVPETTGREFSVEFSESIGLKSP